MSDGAGPADRETRLRRLAIRCWRRGTKEMDLLLGGFFDAAGRGLDDADLAEFERLVEVDDDKLYAWITGAAEAPAQHADLVRRIAGSPGKPR